MELPPEQGSRPAGEQVQQQVQVLGQQEGQCSRPSDLGWGWRPVPAAELGQFGPPGLQQVQPWLAPKLQAAAPL